jgi:hypothetical protein
MGKFVAMSRFERSNYVMRNSIVIQASGAAAVTLVMGSVLSGTAYAATSVNNNPATHAPISVSYDNRVLVLINQLENGISQSTLESNFHLGQTVPGGPMIPASGLQVNPGGPMIPASTSNTTAATYQQLANAANLFTQMLRTDEMDGKSKTVSADISQSNRVLRALKSTFITSTKRARYSTFSSFTPAELSAAHCAARFLEDMVNNS